MSAYIRVDLQRRIRDRFEERCAYCQTAEFLTAMTFEFEHIRPLAAGGKTVFENLCLACPSCNRHKGDRQDALDPNSGHFVRLFHPQQQVWAEHFGWVDSGKRLEGMTATGRATIVALHTNRPALVRARAMWIALGEHPPGSLPGEKKEP